MRAAELFGVGCGEDAKSIRRCASSPITAARAEFLIHDGVMPSNDGRGYVLRKIMRRAMRHARRIGVQDPFLYRLTGFVAELMKPAYPELMESVERVARVVKDEEHRYATTFQVAEKIFHDEARSGQRRSSRSASRSGSTIPMACRLEEQEEMAREYGLQMDRAGFQPRWRSQRERARASWKGAERAAVAPVYQELLSQGRTEIPRI